MSVLNFSPSNILETMDTIVLDRVAQNEGKVALQKVYDTIAADILKTLRWSGDHYSFDFAGMYVGVELDGYMHT